MKNILLVPIQTDALFLSEDTLLTEATADFSHLPYFNGTRDVNADVANISENVVSQPLQDQNLRFRKGLHLHWALPDAMNRGQHKDEEGKTEFPVVPNRWLITKKVENEIENSWVVESDYLFPEDKYLAEHNPLRKERRNSITVPVEIGDRESGNQPFRYMGRVKESNHYEPTDAHHDDRYPKLTTIGYGEPSFAAFYPNCRSVFGFHDPLIDESSGPVTYEIIGWYAQEKNDFFQNLNQGTVEITLEELERNLPELSEEKVDEIWHNLLDECLDHSPFKETPVERAIIKPLSEWSESLLEDIENSRALKYLAERLTQHQLEKTGWAVEPIITKEEWSETVRFTPSEVLWDLLMKIGWLKPVPGQPDQAYIAWHAGQDFNDLAEVVEPGVDAAFDTMVENFNRVLPLERLRQKKSPAQVLLYSQIQASGFANGKQPEKTDKTDSLDIAIGKTGTEALSSYLAQFVDKPNQPSTVGYSHFTSSIPEFEPGFRNRAWDAFLQAGWLRNPANGIAEVAPKEERTHASFPSVLNDYRSNFEQLFASFDAAHEKRLLELAEEQLESLFLLDQIEHRSLDFDAKFDEARHDKGFNAIAGGHRWTISMESKLNKSEAEAEILTLPEDIAQDLRHINRLQKEYDKEREEWNSLGTQLFTDWYKYMMSTYPPEDTRIDHPDIDEVRYFIEENVINPLKEKADKTGIFKLATAEELKKDNPPAYLDPKDASSSVSLANQLTKGINELFDKLKSLNLDRDEPFRYIMKRIGGSRYYEPKEPVVLLVNRDESNHDLRPTRRHGQDGRLICTSFSFDFPSDNYLSEPKELKQILPTFQWLKGDPSQDRPGFTQWTEQPWNPFRLDWEIEVVPLNNGTNQNGQDFHPEFLMKSFEFEKEGFEYAQQNFALPVNSPDLQPIDQTVAIMKGRNPNIYTGKSLLTPQAKRGMKERLEAFISEHGNTPEAKRPPQWKAAVEALEIISKEGFHLLSQSFSGFNDAMLQLRQTYQLPIADPIGFLDYQPFTEEVARLAEDSTHLSPQPLTDFNPILNGKMEINELSLVDTFGQKRKIDLSLLDRVAGAGQKQTKDKESIIEVALQPRLPQPTRLNFRWLNAEAETQESDKAASPICGWILTNQLDDSLVIYGADGEMLGSIEAEPGENGLAKWNPAPGGSVPIFPDSIPNVHLKNMVEKIRLGGEEYVAHFLDGLDNVLSTIEPENFDSQQALSLLVGRPVALVRASFGFEIQGAAAVDQGWRAFYNDRKEHDVQRKRDGFTQVKFPIRLGKHDQFNDGLVGFWKEKNEALSDDFYFNYFSTENHPGIEYLDDTKVPIQQPLFQVDDSTPATGIVSMLIDPRGVVHATTGILPVKAIDIPPDQFLSAMQNMAITFLTAPLLSPAANVSSLLPTVEGFEWTWLERAGQSHWREITTYSTIDRGIFLRAFSKRLLSELIDAGWVRHFFEEQYEFNSAEEPEPISHFTEKVDEDVYGILEEVSIEKMREDGSRYFLFQRKDFEEKIEAENDLGGQLWDLLFRSDVQWCHFIPDQPETFVVLPLAERSGQELPGFGMETWVEEILIQHTQVLKEPQMNAQFDRASMTIREGYLKLKMSKAEE